MPAKKPEILNGEWLDTPPTIEQTMEFLEAQGATYSVKVADYAAYLIPLSQSKNVSLVPKRKEYKTVWNLYMSVAGRIQMFNDDMAARELVGDIMPDQNCEPPGWVYRDNELLVYRVACRVSVPETSEGVTLNRAAGIRYGTAWVPWTGGAGAVKSNRFEKVETSATGRALAAWGYGVLPGSGIASLDEMLSARELPTEQPKAQPKADRDELEIRLDAAISDWAEVVPDSLADLINRIGGYVKKQWGIDIQDEQDDYWMSKLNDGQLMLLEKQVRGKIRDILKEE